MLPIKRKICFGFSIMMSITMLMPAFAAELQPSCEKPAIEDPVPQGVCNVRPDSILPALTGPYCVGTTEVHVVDPSREETFTDDPNDKRELMLRLWYPIDPGTTGEYAEYMDQASFDWMIKVFMLGRIFTLPADANDQIKPHAIKNAPLAGNNRQFPLIIFSPGLFYASYSYAAFVENLASHGFVVAVVGHPYVGGITVFPGGRTVVPPEIPKNLSAIEELVAKGFGVMTEDIGTMMRRLEELNSGSVAKPDEAQWVCRIDADRVGMLGHSLGGAVAIQMCAQDERFKACVNMDGVPLGSALETGTEKPVLFLRSVNRFKDSIFEDLWTKLYGDAYSARVIGAGHTGYSDVGIMLKHFMPKFPRVFLGIGIIDPYELVEISNKYILNFYNAYLNGATTSPISDIRKEHRRVIFKSQ